MYTLLANKYVFVLILSENIIEYSLLKLNKVTIFISFTNINLFRSKYTNKYKINMYIHFFFNTFFYKHLLVIMKIKLYFMIEFVIFTKKDPL